MKKILSWLAEFSFIAMCDFGFIWLCYSAIGEF